MSRRLLACTALLLALALALAGAGSAAAADVTRETRVATGFTRIAIDGDADVVLRQGTTQGVTLEATPQALQRIRTVVRDRTLTVTLDEQRSWWQWMFGGGKTRSPRITIDVVQLERIEAAGSVRFSGSRLVGDELELEFAGACSISVADLQVSRLRVEGAGAVKAELAGKVTEQAVELSGAGSYQAPRLVSDIAELEVSGAGKAVVNVQKSLRVTISGAGSIQYVGNPTVEQEISGVGKISRIEAP
jgi:hypothetical protein